MNRAGWKELLPGASWMQSENRFPIAAYSEFIPPCRVGVTPYEPERVVGFDESDPWGWPVSEAEEERELRPGLEQIGSHLVQVLAELAHGRPSRGLSRRKLENN